MKKLFITIIALTMLQIAQAQSRIGVKAGLNLATYSGEDADDLDMLTSLHAGLFGNLVISDMISIQPELLYSGQGAKFDVLGTEVTSFQQYINIPVMLQLKFGPVYGEIGPQLGILISSEVSGGGVSLDNKDDLTPTDVGVGIGAGFKSESGFGIGARYTMGITSLDDDADDTIDTDIKNAVFSIGLFFAFGSK